eukprot:EG_transcript_34351
MGREEYSTTGGLSRRGHGGPVVDAVRRQSRQVRGSLRGVGLLQRHLLPEFAGELADLLVRTDGSHSIELLLGGIWWWRSDQGVAGIGHQALAAHQLDPLQSFLQPLLL